MKKSISLLLALLLLAPLFAPPVQAASEKELSIRQAVSYAIATDYSYKKKANQIILKRMEYTQAVEAVNARWRDLRSFRWSPLFSFKFPEMPYADEHFELATRPSVVESEVKKLRMEQEDLRFSISEKVQTTFCDAYLLQEQIAFSESALREKQDTLSRNQGLLTIGRAKQADVDSASASIKAEEASLAALKRDFESKKKKLSQEIGVDVSYGYHFQNPLNNFQLNRSLLPNILKHTLGRSYQVYEAKSDASLSLNNLDIYLSLYQNKYGWMIYYILADVQQARNGNGANIDYNAFLSRYQQFLVQIDTPWSGTFRILFFRFPRVWKKGKLDGTRYIDNERYALYIACMEYTDAQKNLELVTREVESQVETSFDALITEYNAYLTIADEVTSAKSDLERVRQLNQAGRALFDEVQSAQQDYQDAQNERLAALTSYTQNLISFDRLTCGAVTNLRSGVPLQTDVGTGGDSYLETEPIERPYYYISQPVTDYLFAFGVHIPDDFTPNVTAFELWYDGVQIGARTDTGQELRHMPLTYRETGKLSLRLYNGEDFVDEAELDVTIPRGIIPFHSAAPPAESRLLGTYSITADAVTGLSSLALKLVEDSPADSYVLESIDGKIILPNEKHDVNEPFSYFNFALSDMTALRCLFYNSAGELLYTADFDVLNKQLLRADEAASSP